jgi:hypothetical protein
MQGLLGKRGRYKEWKWLISRRSVKFVSFRSEKRPDMLRTRLRKKAK